MRHIPLPLLNTLIARTDLDPNFLSIGSCCEAIFGLVASEGKVRERFLDLLQEQC